MIFKSLCESHELWFFYCAARPHFHFYLLSDVSLTVEIGVNSRTIIVIAGHVWVSPWPCLGSPSGSSLYGFSSRSLVVIEVLCRSFRMSSEIIWVSVLIICSLCQGQFSRKPKHTYTNRIFKSVYWGLNLTKRLSLSDEEPFRVIEQRGNESFWSNSQCLRLHEFLKLINSISPTNQTTFNSLTGLWLA